MPEPRRHFLAWAAVISITGLAVVGDEPGLVFRSAAAGLPELWVWRDAEAAPVRLLAAGIAALDPAASGGTVAFMRPGPTGRQSIWLARLNGGALRRLSPDGVDERMPAFSPDGERLALVRDDGRGGTSIRLASLTDGGSRDLTAGHGSRVTNLFPAWSPDGRTLAFASNRGGRFRIWIMRADGGDPRAVTAAGAGDLAPTWSPDGRQIAFVRQFPDGTADLLVRELASGSERRIELPGVESGPAWSPAGDRIAFASDRDGDLEIYTVRPDGSGLLRLTDNTVDDDAPAWLPRPGRASPRTR